MTSSIYPLSLSIGTTGTVTAVAVVLGGSGYIDSETVTLVSALTGIGSTGTVAVTAGAVTAVTVVLAGTGYTNGETLTIIGTGTGATGTATTTTISAATDILSSDLAITSDQVKPGGGGILRLSFGFKFATTPSTISIFNNGVLKGNLNADNSAQVITDGYYRFDIDVESGDNLNLQSSQIVDIIRFIRAHLVQFGA